MPNSARIQINVTSFVPNASPAPAAPFCVINLPFIPNGPGNSGLQDAEKQVGVHPDGTIWVNRKNSGGAPVRLVFNIGPDASIVPTGILFRQTAGEGDNDGRDNFRNISTSGTTLTFDNHWRARGKRKHEDGTNHAPRWKYFIRVLQGSTAGWIDPGIENAEDL